MEAAALMAIVLANGGGRPPDWQDFVGIMVLLVINSTISFIEENNAGNAAAALMAGLAPKTKVKNENDDLNGLYLSNEYSIFCLVFFFIFLIFSCLSQCRFSGMVDGRSKMLQSWFQET